MQLTAEQRYQLISQQFPAWLLAEPIVFPRNHSTYGWACPVVGCLGAPGQTYTNLMCVQHAIEFAEVRRVDQSGRVRHRCAAVWGPQLGVGLGSPTGMRNLR